MPIIRYKEIVHWPLAQLTWVEGYHFDVEFGVAGWAVWMAARVTTSPYIYYATRTFGDPYYYDDIPF